jgi:hypothetical protein
MDFQTDYDQLTKTIDDTLTNQLSSTPRWTNIAGMFQRVVSSSSGYAWGINNTNNKVFICQEPCNGDWKEVELPKNKPFVPLIIKVDDSTVYLLVLDTVEKKELLLTNIVSGKGEWKQTFMPENKESFGLFVTGTYIWVQYIASMDGSGGTIVKYKCVKPCTTASWIKAATDSIMISSSTDNQLFGTDTKTGKNVKADENIVSGWSSSGVISQIDARRTVVGKTNTSDFYLVDGGGWASKHIYKCKEGECDTHEKIQLLDTQGYEPSTLSVEPTTNTLWMTTFSPLSPTDKGNVFRLSDKKNDYSAILNTIDPLDKKRHEIAQDVSKQFSDQTKTLTTNKQIQAVIDFFSQQFGYTKNVEEQTKNETSAITETIQKNQGEIDKKTMISDKLFKLIITLAIAIFIYVFAETLLGIYVHLIVAPVLIGGIIFTIYY